MVIARIDERRRSVSGAVDAPGGRADTATGHQVGATYYSLSHQSRYEVIGVATTWELAPGRCVSLRWENGNRTTSAVPRGVDPEVCRACDRLVAGPAWLPLGRCRCGATAARLSAGAAAAGARTA